MGAWALSTWRDGALLDGSWTGGIGGTPPTILFTDLPNAGQGIPYSYQMLAEGTAPITWTVTVGALPTDLAIASDYIEGTPSVAEAQTFTLRAANSYGNDTVETTLTVVATPEGTVVTKTLGVGYRMGY